MKTITIISHYNGIELNLRLNDENYNALAAALIKKDITEIIDDNNLRTQYGYALKYFSPSQHRKINTFFAKDNIEYFDKIEL